MALAPGYILHGSEPSIHCSHLCEGALEAGTFAWIETAHEGGHGNVGHNGGDAIITDVPLIEGQLTFRKA